MCAEYAKELAWALLTKHDTENLGNDLLQAELDIHFTKVCILLFELLKTIYDPASINVIAEVINRNGQSLENQFFALELLDNILSINLKPLLIPLFEPVLSEQKINHLKSIFSIEGLTASDKLKDILMRDYKIIGPAIKELALINYYQLTGDIQLLKGFRHNKLGNLNSRAVELLDGEIIGNSTVKQLKNNLSNLYDFDNNSLTCLLNWAVKPKKEKQIHAYHIDIPEMEGYVVDALAIALLIS